MIFTAKSQLKWPLTLKSATFDEIFAHAADYS